MKNLPSSLFGKILTLELPFVCVQLRNQFTGFPARHLWLKLLLSKTATTSLTLIKCFKPQDTDSSSVITVSMHQNFPLTPSGAGESKGRRWAEALSQHCACKTSQAAKRRTDTAASAIRKHKEGKKLSQGYRTRFKIHLLHGLQQTLNGTFIHRRNRKTWRN